MAKSTKKTKTAQAVEEIKEDLTASYVFRVRQESYRVSKGK